VVEQLLAALVESVGQVLYYFEIQELDTALWSQAISFLMAGATQHNTLQRSTARCNAAQHGATQHNTCVATQHNTLQHSTP
jgi:Na+-translocating ferredoxin:NAD+ oxidoreductase RnfG subunit